MRMENLTWKHVHKKNIQLLCYKWPNQSRWPTASGNVNYITSWYYQQIFSEAGAKRGQTQSAPSWMAFSHLTWAGAAQRDLPALNLLAVLSLGTRWMTYSVRRAQVSQRTDPAALRENCLHKRGRARKDERRLTCVQRKTTETRKNKKENRERMQL